MKRLWLAVAVLCVSARGLSSPYSPETWFHVIEGNASKEGLAADIRAIADAGIGGIQFFHGGFGDTNLWPGVGEAVPCLSPKWEDLIGCAADECARRGLTFKMQNCPGWSMSGGPWIKPDNAMRTLVAFEPGRMPKWEDDDDYREIGSVTFPCVSETGQVPLTDARIVTNEQWRTFSFSEPVAASAVAVPSPLFLNRDWSYDPQTRVTVTCDGRTVLRRDYPPGCWQDWDLPQTFRLDCAATGRFWKVSFDAHHPVRTAGRFIGLVQEPVLDSWEAKAAWTLRGFSMSTNAAPVRTVCRRTLVFGHVNARVQNGPAPKEGRGWECDKMDAHGYEANWAGYLGRLVRGPLKGGKLKGTLVDSWECGRQTWTWRMEDEFARQNGYALRPWMPALFGHVLKSEAETERFLLDWRRTCSRLVEENYFGTMSRIAHENGMSIQFETAFGDVVPGDILRYWKYADEPMCEFWSPFDDRNGFVYSHDFKSVRPCVSAAHVYGKRRVSAEAFTSFKLTFDESFQELKENANRHFARGVTHLVFHTYTHNPVVGGKPPSTSFGAAIGTPFLRLQPWWKYMPEFTGYLEYCCRELERGMPVVDILRYLGDDLNHRPSEKTDLFDNRYKYDYLNGDALMTRVGVKDGRLVFPDGMSYRLIWVPTGTFLLPETEKKFAELERQGARIVRGDLMPDWDSPLAALVQNRRARALPDYPRYWYQRRDGDEDVFFCAETNGVSYFDCMKGGRHRIVDPVTRRPRIEGIRDGGRVAVTLAPEREYAPGETERVYGGTVRLDNFGRVVLDLGKVCHWATVKVNGKVAARLWCKPYQCDISAFAIAGENRIEVSVTSTIYNQLVVDAAKPESERKTWTLCGPKAGAPFSEAGLFGPVVLIGQTCMRQR